MDCLFCSVANHTSPLSGYPENRVVAETDNFVAKAALGQVVNGYSLILTKEHYRSFSEAPIEIFDEFYAFRNKIVNRLECIYKVPIAYFEHGAVHRQYRAGSCIDHAHIHLIPTAMSIIPFIIGDYKFEMLSSFYDVKQYWDAKDSYFYLEEDGTCKGARIDCNVPSQLIRRVLAKMIGHPNEWDWREYPTRDKVQGLVDAFISELI